MNCKFDLGSFYKEILCIHLNGNPLYFFDFILQGNPLYFFKKEFPVKLWVQFTGKSFVFFTREFPVKFYREILCIFFDF